MNLQNLPTKQNKLLSPKLPELENSLASLSIRSVALGLTIQPLHKNLQDLSKMLWYYPEMI